MTSPFSALHFPTGMAVLLLVAAPVAAAGSPASFDAIYTGSVAVTSVRPGDPAQAGRRPDLPDAPDPTAQPRLAPQSALCIVRALAPCRACPG